MDTRVKFNANNFKKLFSVYKENTGKELTQKTLESINFYNNDEYLKKGSLLFTDDCNDSNTIIHCRLWDSLTKGTSIVLDDKETKFRIWKKVHYVKYENRFYKTRCG